MSQLRVVDNFCLHIVGIREEKQFVLRIGESNSTIPHRLKSVEVRLQLTSTDEGIHTKHLLGVFLVGEGDKFALFSVILRCSLV